MVKVAVIVALGAVSCGGKTATHVAPEPMKRAAALDAGIGGVSYGGAAYGGAAYGGAAGGATVIAVPAQGSALAWTVTVTDNATSKPLAGVSITAYELTWDCKTREVPEPPDERRHHPVRIEQYDCKGGKDRVTKLTDAHGSVTLQLPHAQYDLAPIQQQGYFPSNFPDPVYQRLAQALVKTSVANGSASRLTEYRLFPTAAVVVKTDAQAEALALKNPIVRKCMAQHPQLTHKTNNPSLLWRVEFLYAGAKNMELEATVDSLSGEVGFLGCWDPCCAQRAPSRFEKRLVECARMRGTNDPMRKNWDCDTLAQDWVKLQDFLRNRGETAELKRYEDLYRAYEAGN